jgi:hypothetical protein
MGVPGRSQVEHVAALDDENLSSDDRRRIERYKERRELAREEKKEEQREERREQIREAIKEERRDERREERPVEPVVARDLNPQEVREMQRLLNRAGYSVHADGVFGEQSRDALSAFERRVGMRDDGYPTFEALERLRRDFR